MQKNPAVKSIFIKPQLRCCVNVSIITPVPDSHSLLILTLANTLEVTQTHTFYFLLLHGNPTALL